MQALQHNLDAKSEDALRTQQQLDEAQAQLREFIQLATIPCHLVSIGHRLIRHFVHVKTNNLGQFKFKMNGMWKTRGEVRVWTVMFQLVSNEAG